MSDALDGAGEEVLFRRLHPEIGTADVDSLLDGWFSQSRVPEVRPRVAINFAVTADGAIALANGVSGGIGDEGDLALFKGLRDRADAILAGSQTVAAEGYGRLIRDAARRVRRQERGLAQDPLMVLLSRSGELPVGAPIFDCEEQGITAFVPRGVEVPQVKADLKLVGLDEPSAGSAFEHLASAGVSRIVCEGGPRITSALIRDGLVDDVFLTIAPRLAGGGEAGLVNGQPLAVPTEMRLSSVAERDGSLFVRWTRAS